ncbi:M64 family metallopeptidase [Streptomyces sp. M19]
MGHLADEYTYDEYGEYTGDEPGEPNSTKLTADQMTEQQQKWYRFIGEESPDGGTVGAYEGSGYYPRACTGPPRTRSCGRSAASSTSRARGDDRGLLPPREGALQHHRHEVGARPLRPDHRRHPGGRHGDLDRRRHRGHLGARRDDGERRDPRHSGGRRHARRDGEGHGPHEGGARPALRKLLTSSRTWKVTG